MASRFASMTSEEIIQINILCGVYYLTVLVYTTTSETISDSAECYAGL